MRTLHREIVRINVVRGLRALAVFLLVLSPLAAARAQTDNGASLLAQARATHWIAEGHGAHVVYVIFDPNCPYCHLEYKESQHHLKNFRFRWIPVGILTHTSRAKAAALLDAKSPVAALRYNENHFVMERGKGGGIAPARHVSAATQDELKVNLAMLQATGASYVPVTLFRSRDGKVHIIGGALTGSDFSSMLHEVAGKD